mmetsp:Transcript_14719/g.29946  ORF Transcript_14719/g.29946 Transcript_14719/m.29946 type:complete len:500 (+) Transcript_14719:365-1864(+)
MQHSGESSLPSPGEIHSSSTSFSMGCCLNVLRFCNTFAVTILSCMVGWIFVQLQYVHYSLNQESDRIDDLLKQIQENQSHQIDQLNQRVDENQNLALYQMAGVFVTLVCLLTMFHMSSHLRNYHEPIVQRKIITILWMSPIYGVTSFFSLVFPQADGYLAVIRDFYEAYVVYNFLSFLIAVLGRGNREVVVDVLAQHADHLAKPTRCLQSFYYPPPDSSDKALANAVLFECQVLAMQFVLVRPLTSVANFVSITVHDPNQTSSDDGPWAYFLSPGFYIAMVTNITVFLAFRGLLRFYHAAKDDLMWMQPFSKFMAIKGIVFLTFWQGLAISIFVNLHESAKGSNDGSSSSVYGTNSTHSPSQGNSDDGHKSPHELAQEIQNVLICLEMLFFSIAHWCVFPAEEWEPGYRRKEFAAPGLGLKDFARDVKFIMESRRRRRLGSQDDIEGSLHENHLQVPSPDGEKDEEGHDSLALQENVGGDDELTEVPRSSNSPYQATLQ